MNYPIKWSTSNKLRIFKVASNRLNNTSLRDAIGQSNIKEGDIVLLERDKAYVYVNNFTYTKYGLKREPYDGTTSLFYPGPAGGGWIPSVGYITRSVTASSYNNSNYIYITSLGNTVLPADGTSSSLPVLNLDFAFTI